MTARERPIPAASSSLAGPPTLTPKVGPLKVGDGGDRQEHDDDQEEREPRRPSRPGRTRGGRRPPPAAADAIPTTVRFDEEEAREISRFVLELQDAAGRRTLDKAEVIRELLRQAREHEPTRKALLRRLR